MNTAQYQKNLLVPGGRVDVVLDSDAYNEIDDQYAIAYMLRSRDRLNVKAICAAPFLNPLVSSPAEGMERSYLEIVKVLNLSGREDLVDQVYMGSKSFMEDSNVPVQSAAAKRIARMASFYTPEKPLYIIAIGAITNVASAILLNPRVKENTVVVWLGGHALHMPNPLTEFNMRQDVAAARCVMDSGVPLVLLPCFGVVDRFFTTGPELEHWLKGKNTLCDYLVSNTQRKAESYAKGKPWSRTIWDVTAVAWLLNDDDRFMKHELIPSPIPEVGQGYRMEPDRPWNFAVAGDGAAEYQTGSDTRWDVQAELPSVTVSVKPVENWKIETVTTLEGLDNDYNPLRLTGKFTLTPSLPEQKALVCREPAQRLRLYPYGACKVRMTVLPVTQEDA